jgi:putative ABC transport system permease protein
MKKEGDNRPMTELPPINVRFCSGDYFRTMGIPLVAGRAFVDSDRNRKVGIVSEIVARQVWPGENAIGKRFGDGDDKDLMEVVGVVRDVRVGLDKKPVLTEYQPYWQQSETSMNVVLRTAMDERAIAPGVRDAIWSIDPDTVIGEMQTMQKIVSRSVGQRKFQMQLIAGFAAAALLLACIGIYGVVAWSTARRKNEIGIRMALGARSGGVERMVMANGMRPVLAGLAVGTVAALALGRVLGSVLFGISAHDPLTIISVACVLAGTAALACWIPARRATRADPLDALRYE